MAKHITIMPESTLPIEEATPQVEHKIKMKKSRL